jgi:hypothetical protein
MITDNAIIAFECFHALQKGSKTAGNFCAYKLDLMKAYDRVDWNFLEEAMRKFGFAEQWIKWIMACVKTVRYSVRFNGKLLERFIPTRGLRQGDPLSPYLFLFVGESLSALLKHQINSNLIEELKICRKSPGISHLLFADDSLLFFRATPEQATCVNVVLRDYERGTGQLLSPAKCSIMLGQHCSEEDGAAVAAILNVGSMTMEDKYLGLPIPEGCIKEGKLKSSKEKLRKKCSDWNEKYMSGAAKETLIKSVAQAITTYAMSVFKFPAGLCDELSQIIRDFWWGDEEEKRKVHWMAWDKLTLPKSQGGIGFRDLRMFNQALLAKQAWRLIQFPESLCARLLKSKYYPSGELTDTVFSQGVSPCWQGITHGLELLKKGIIWRIGSGTKVKIWRDNWLPRGNHKVIGKASKQRLRWVSDLINPATRSWDEAKVRSVLYPPDAEEALRITLSPSQNEDFIAWAHESNGIFSVRSAYKLGMELQEREGQTATSTNPQGDRSLWNLIWTANVPPKLKVFGWKLATNTLGVQVHRCRRNMEVMPTCTLCGREPETAHHAVVACTKATALRQCLRKTWPLPTENFFSYTGNNWVLVLLDQCSAEMRSKLIFLWWRAWHLRNNSIFGDGKCGIEQSALFIQSYLVSFMQANEPDVEKDYKGKTVVQSLGDGMPKKKEHPAAWTKPDEGWQKLNVDASFSIEENKGTWGAVLRDHEGKVLVTAWGLINHCLNAEMAEGIAVLEGVKAIIALASTHVVVECDNANVIKELKMKDRSNSQLAFVISYTKDLLSLLPGYKVQKVNRAGNFVAHDIASFCKNVGYGGVLLDSFPSCVLERVNMDCKGYCIVDSSG